jgi:ubiquinone/menaquinone biosynthesis C-methylase UbiE
MKAALIFPLIRIALSVSLATAALNGADPARDAREAAREVEWKVPGIFGALGLGEGRRIADIGSGDGFLTVRLAAGVGREGRVFAVDIDGSALERLKKRIEETGTKNVEIIKGTEADPLLGPASLDGAVILRAYHEFSRHREMLAKIRAALRPGGRLVIADVGPAAVDGNGSRASQVSRHVLAYTIAANELAEAGFRLAVFSPSFARLDNGETVWLLAAERP